MKNLVKLLSLTTLLSTNVLADGSGPSNRFTKHVLNSEESRELVEILATSDVFRTVYSDITESYSYEEEVTDVFCLYNKHSSILGNIPTKCEFLHEESPKDSATMARFLDKTLPLNIVDIDAMEFSPTAVIKNIKCTGEGSPLSFSCSVSVASDIEARDRIISNRL